MGTLFGCTWLCLNPFFFQVSHFLSYINPWWPWGAFKWTCNFLPPFMSRAFKLTIINIYFDWPLACRSQLYNEGMRRNISSFQKNWKDPTVAKFKLSSWGNYWNFCAFVNLDVDPRLHLYICTHTHTHTSIRIDLGTSMQEFDKNSKKGQDCHIQCITLNDGPLFR